MLRTRWILLLASLGAVWTASAGAPPDLSNPMKLMFVADAERNIIDVIDLDARRTVFRIETRHPVDDLVATPKAPVLVYTNIERRLVSLYDLRTRQLAREITLPIVPRHMVLDTSGSRIGFSDSQDGGFVLFSAYAGSIFFTLEDFPPARDVLFDPNEVEIYYSNSATGSIGVIDVNLKKAVEMQVADVAGQPLTSPSRSLDGRHVYVANEETGEVYSLNAFSKVVYRTFHVGNEPARPYTTPEGVFLYMMDRDSGRFLSIDQNRFEPHADVKVGPGIDIVAVGRFDRMNLFMSTTGRRYHVFDNVRRSITRSGEFNANPLDALGSIDGKTAYVAFRDKPQVAFVDFDSGEVQYVRAGENGIGAFAVGLSNNVCH